MTNFYTGARVAPAAKSYPLGQSFRRLTRAEREMAHEVLNSLLLLLEGKEIKFQGEKLSCILHPLTVEALAAEGWTDKDFREFKLTFFDDIEHLPDVDVPQYVPRVVCAELKKRGLEHLIFENRVVGIPGEIENALICAELLQKYAEADLMLCGIFTKVRDFDADGQPCDALHLDVDAWLGRRGFMMPVVESGLIDGLKVFRHLDDERPFRLRARSDLIDLTGGKNEGIY